MFKIENTNNSCCQVNTIQISELRTKINEILSSNVDKVAAIEIEQPPKKMIEDDVKRLKSDVSKLTNDVDKVTNATNKIDVSKLTNAVDKVTKLESDVLKLNKTVPNIEKIEKIDIFKLKQDIQKLKFDLDQKIKNLETTRVMVSSFDAELKKVRQKFSLNFKGTYDSDLKKTMFFPLQGLILTEKVYMYSIVILTNTKNKKHDCTFILSKENENKIVWTYSRSNFPETYIEEFDTPLEFEAKTPIFFTCDQNIETAVIITLSY